ncbi:MAG: hypothetical protein HFJ81_03020 [Clostridia bacterium]|nr:hypothetical protein [Clostridia bacterium]
MKVKKKQFNDMTDKERKKVGKKYAKYVGGDGFTVFLYVIIALALCFSAPFAVCGLIWRSQGEIWFISGIICCVATVFLVGCIFLVKLWRNKRMVKNKEKLNVLTEEYDKEALKESKNFWLREHWLYGMFNTGFEGNNSKDPTVRALHEAAKNAAFKHSDSGYVSTSNASNEVRIKTKDGKILHTEERFGDYKTYIYDESGNNTGMHLSGDKVLDDNYNEVGSFNDLGEFIEKK